MGQRLVVTVCNKENEKLANSYFHWSAYTVDSIHVTQEFIAAWEAIPAERRKEVVHSKNIIRLRDLICVTMMNAWEGAKPTCSEEIMGKLYPNKLDDEDKAEPEIHKIYKLKLLSEGLVDTAMNVYNDDEEEVSRDNGLIGFTELSIDDNLEFAEYCVDIYLDSNGEINEIYFGVIYIDEETALIEWEKEAKVEHPEEDIDVEKDMYRVPWRFEDDAFLIQYENWDKFANAILDAIHEGKTYIGTDPEIEPDITKRTVIMMV